MRQLQGIVAGIQNAKEKVCIIYLLAVMLFE